MYVCISNHTLFVNRKQHTWCRNGGSEPCTTALCVCYTRVTWPFVYQTLEQVNPTHLATGSLHVTTMWGSGGQPYTRVRDCQFRPTYTQMYTFICTYYYKHTADTGNWITLLAHQYMQQLSLCVRTHVRITYVHTYVQTDRHTCMCAHTHMHRYRGTL